MTCNKSVSNTSVGLELEQHNHASICKEVELDALNLPQQDADEYPKGANLAFIVIALILSIFLASLDMVSVLTYPIQTQI